MWTECAGVTASPDYFDLIYMGKCRILWEKMGIVSKEGDLAIEMYELCCCTFRIMACCYCNFAI